MEDNKDEQKEPKSFQLTGVQEGVSLILVVISLILIDAFASWITEATGSTTIGGLTWIGILILIGGSVAVGVRTVKSKDGER